jgi:hypothetical protein
MRSIKSWPAPPLSTTSDAAERYYWHGISSLVAGIPHAEESLAEAVAVDPDFFLARIGIATVRALAGVRYQVPASTNEILRGERHHAEIVKYVFMHEHRRAADLRREHLLEYPGDLLIVWLPAAAFTKLGISSRQELHHAPVER